MLSDEAKAARAAYQKEWRKRNPEKVKEQMERHWERVAAAKQEEASGEGGASGC